MSAITLFDLNGEQRFTGTSVGGGGSQPSLVDLGVVHIVDLLNGDQNLYTPASPEYVSVISLYPVTLPDHQNLTVVQDTEPFGSDPRRVWGMSTSQVLPVNANLVPEVSTRPVVAGIATETTGYFIDEALGVWQANHVYAAKTCISAAGHIWSSSAGTSGGSAPDFAGNIGGTVVDNTVTWTDEGVLPTTGSVHLYALVATT